MLGAHSVLLTVGMWAVRREGGMATIRRADKPDLPSHNEAKQQELHIHPDGLVPPAAARADTLDAPNGPTSQISRQAGWPN
jgi:hypothetical protein